MLDNQIAEKYSQALFELAVEKEALNKVQKELTEVLETISGHGELNEILYHPQISQKEKKSLVDELFGSEISQILLNFLKLLIDKRREKFLEAIANSFMELVNKENELLEVKVKSAFELSATNKTRLKNKLEQLTSKEVAMDIEIDSDLIGGLVLKIGDRVVDGSLVKQLEVMKNDLTKIEVGVN